MTAVMSATVQYDEHVKIWRLHWLLRSMIEVNALGQVRLKPL